MRYSRWDNMEEAERILRKVVWSDGCWEWLGAKHRKRGSAYFGGRSHPAHRAVWMLLVGEIPRGLTLDHLCRNPGCVNPDHLEPCSMEENIARYSRVLNSRVLNPHDSRQCSFCLSILGSP